MLICSHSFLEGIRFLFIECEIISINMPAMRNLKIEITKGWADSNPIFVAVEAEDHNKENRIPIKIIFHFLDFILVETLTVFVVYFKMLIIESAYSFKVSIVDKLSSNVTKLAGKLVAIFPI